MWCVTFISIYIAISYISTVSHLCFVSLMTAIQNNIIRFIAIKLEFYLITIFYGDFIATQLNIYVCVCVCAYADPELIASKLYRTNSKTQRNNDQ